MLNRDEMHDPANNYFPGSAYSRSNFSIEGPGGSIIRIGGINSSSGFGGNISSSNGVVSVTHNGVTTRYIGESGSVEHGRLYIDGIQVQANDPRLVNGENKQPEFKANHAGIRNRLEQKAPAEQQPLNPEESFLRNCSQFAKIYIEGLKKKKSHTDIVKDMKLSAEEMALLDNYCDPVSMEVMNIPVKLHGNVYDFSTVLSLYAKDKKDIARNDFTPENIAPSRKTVQELEDIIKKIELDRKNKIEMKGEPANPNHQAMEIDPAPVQMNPQTEEFLNKCSPFTKQYIDSFKNKKSHRDIIKEMQLSPEEMNLLKNYCDPITMKVMNKPVKLNGNIYDLDTVVSLYNKEKQDVARNVFTPEHVAASRRTVQEFEEIIKKIESHRKVAANEHAIAPGGPGFMGAPGGMRF